VAAAPPRRTALLVAAGLVLALLLAVFAVPRPAPPPPSPERPETVVVDKAGLLTPAALSGLNSQLHGLEGLDAVLYIDGPAPAGSLAAWTGRAVSEWRVGRAGGDRGLVLFVFRDAGLARAEVGYGLEADLPDLWLEQMLQAQLVPPFAQGRFEQGIEQAVDAVQRRVRAAAEAAAASGPRPSVWARTWDDARRHGARLVPAVWRVYREGSAFERGVILAFATPPLLVTAWGLMTVALVLHAIASLPGTLRAVRGAQRDAEGTKKLVGLLFLITFGTFVATLCGAIVVFVLSMAPDLVTRQGLFGGGGATVSWLPAR
jgi:uncharacterized membrane protein YgcG